MTAVYSVGLDPEQMRTVLDRMGRVQRHRGPDSERAWAEEVGPGRALGLGHQRLSILDLSHAADQPMVSPCGRYVLSFNGEIYNFKEIARELEPDPILETSSGDTAVLLAALRRWGHEAFPRLNGMWALVLYDRVAKRLTISRDRAGIKPLYFTLDGQHLVLGSEIKAVLDGSGRRFAANTPAMASYLRFGVVDFAPATLFEGVQTVPAGSFAALDLSAGGIPAPRFERYWDHPFVCGEAASEDAADPDELRELFIDSVRLHLRSDAPVAVTLSGGVDSSAILGAAHSLGLGDRLKAFSAVFDDPQVNEKPFIDRMVAHVGCESVQVNVQSRAHEAWRALPDLCWRNDHPPHSFSSFQLMRICREARSRGIVVLLSGQGADEQLAGYNKFLYSYLFDCMRDFRLGTSAWTALRFLHRGTVFPEFRFAEAKRYLPRLQAAAFGWMNQSVNLCESPARRMTYREREFVDMSRFSIPTLLHIEDRMSMAASTEIRVPFLDHRLVERLARIPAHRKLEKGWTKAVFRKALEPLLPKEIAWRKDKKGFNSPQAGWFRGELRDDVRKLLTGDCLIVTRGLVDQGSIVQAFDRFVAGRGFLSQNELFRVVALEHWLRRFEPYLTAA